MANANNKWRLIEKDSTIEINDNEDPLLEKEFSSYIQISDRPNPGRRALFNGMKNVSTVNVRATGLNMIFGVSMNSKSSNNDGSVVDETDNNTSPLEGLDDRLNVENLYLYADTIIIKRQLLFPQTNVHIHARRLIMTDRGEIRTTPKPIGDFTKSGTKGKVSNGRNAPNSGNVYLHVKEFSSSRNEDSLLTEEIEIPKHIFSKQDDFRTINMLPSMRMYPLGSILEFEFTEDIYDALNIIFVENPTKTLNVNTPAKFLGISIKRSENNAIHVEASGVGYKYQQGIFNNRDKKNLIKFKIIHESKKLTVMGATPNSKFMELCSMKSDVLKSNLFFGISNTNPNADHIKRAELTIKRLPPLFTLNGISGQNGQLGDLLPIPKVSQKDNKAHPVTEAKVWQHVYNFDFIKESTKGWWYRPNLNLLNNSAVLFAKLKLFNAFAKGKKTTIELGNPAASNPDNGQDAFASGNGGKGGNSGTLNYSGGICKAEEVDFLPGALGISPIIKGGKGYLDINAYHVELTFVHGGSQESIKLSGLSLSGTDKEIIDLVNIKTIPSRHGKDGVGENGAMGLVGSMKKIDGQVNAWIHPFMLERAVQFAKNELMRGNRHVARWITKCYQNSLPENPDQLVNYNLQLADLVNEIRIMDNRLNARLDYFGKPIGWVPRLSTLTNIQLLKFVKRNTVETLFYADSLLRKDLSEADVRKQLNFAINHLTQEVKKERKILANAHKELPKVKNELNLIQIEINNVNTDIRRLHDIVVNDKISDARSQALFTGSIQILSGLCHLIPVGQPYVGQIAGNILDVVKDIDINSDTPFEEALGVTDSLSSKLGDFINDNKGDLTKTLTKDLQKSVESNESSIKETQEKAEEFTKQLSNHKPTFENAFESKAFIALKEELEIAQQIDNFEKLEFYTSSDYANLIERIEYLKTQIKEGTKIGSADKKVLEKSLSEVIESQESLKKEKEKLEASRDSRTKMLEKTGNATRAVGQSLSKVSQGLQSMMVNVDPEDTEFKKQIQAALSGIHKEEFNKLKNQLDDLNEKKLPSINRMIELQQIIDTNSGSIMNKMAQIATFSDQRAQMTAGVLTTQTRQYLQKVMEDSRELLLEHIDNLVKSFQYRFLQRVDNDFYQIHQLVKDIQTFQEKGDSIPNKANFKNAYDFALRSQFNSLARKLLADMQGFSAPKKDHFTLKIDKNTRNHNGVRLLDMLKRIGRVNFRLHTLAGGSSKGSDEYFNYRIAGIEFQDITVKTKIDDLSFRFGISHSGQSVIRNIRDQEFYYFTTVNSADGDNQGTSYTRNWDATFNRADINSKPINNGLTNSKHVIEDEKALTSLLISIDEKAEIKYKEHLPGATSMLTLQIHDNKIEEKFEIKELTIKIDYELKN